MHCTLYYVLPPHMVPCAMELVLWPTTLYCSELPHLSTLALCTRPLAIKDENEVAPPIDSCMHISCPTLLFAGTMLRNGMVEGLHTL